MPLCQSIHRRLNEKFDWIATLSRCKMHNTWVISFYSLCLDFRVYSWIEILLSCCQFQLKEYKTGLKVSLKTNNFKKRKHLKFDYFNSSTNQERLCQVAFEINNPVIITIDDNKSIHQLCTAEKWSNIYKLNLSYL